MPHQCLPYETTFILESQHCLQLPHLPPCAGAGQVAPVSTTIEELGQLSLRCPTIGGENRITRLSGLLARWSLIHASRVGSQCRVSGVNLQISKIFCRCCWSWTSPASCHLNHFWRLITAAIAVTQAGCFIASSLLY